MRKFSILCIFAFLFVMSSFLSEPIEANTGDGSGKVVYVIPIEREVERGLEAFLTRTTGEAVEAGADHIIFEIDTPGGRVDSAGQIASLLQSLDIPTTSFIINEALSAGSYIALNTDHIYMRPHATMGASGVITGDGNAADQKAQSAWLAAMKSAAESKGRDPLYAAAMADPDIDLPEYGAPQGEYLTLGPSEALEVNYSDGTVSDRDRLLQELGLSEASIVESETSLAEEVARFLTNPIVIPILLSIASLGLVVELYTPGFGIAGIMGLIALLLFFYGHFVAGLAGLEAIILLIVGIILIILEFFIPGGIIGILGVIAVVGSLIMAGYNPMHMALSIAIAMIVAIIAFVILFKRVGFNKGIFKNIILRDKLDKEQGYNSYDEREELIGKTGIAITPLRPSGIGDFEGERIDIVTEGNFINSGEPIKIVDVEGVRVIVREMD